MPRCGDFGFGRPIGGAKPTDAGACDELVRFSEAARPLETSSGRPSFSVRAWQNGCRQRPESGLAAGAKAMIGERQTDHAALFYEPRSGTSLAITCRRI